MKSKKNTTILIVLGIAVLSSLVPLLYISRYTGMVLDDFGYAANVHLVWKQTHSISKALLTALTDTISYYFTWQGSLISLFLYIFNPGSFGEHYYWVNGVFVILLFIISQYYLIDTVFHNYFGCDKKNCLILWLLLLFLYLNYLPSSAEGFYFFTDAVTYTSFYSVICFHVGIMLKLSKNNKQSLLALDILLAIISAGGHLSMAVLSFVLTGVFLAYHFINKTSNNKKFIPIFIAVTTSLLINALAPGYRVRASGDYGKSFISSIFWSFIQTFKETNNFSKIETLLVIAIVLILLFEISVESVRKIKHPILSSILCIAIYSTQFMPAFYGVGHAEFLRQRNIAFFSFYWLLAALLFIWVFYYRQKGFPQSFTNETIPNFNLVFISLFLISILGTGNLNNITSIAATRAIMNGSAQGYRAERDQWIKDIENSNGTTPVVHYLQHKVDVIDLWGVFELYPDWVLGCMADYYGIDAILLENGDEATLIPSWKNSKH